MTQFLSMHIERAVATIRFERPDKGNAYDRAMLSALAGALARAGEDAAVRVIVLRGEGRHFCAGAEIGADVSTAGGPGIADVCGELDALAKPTLAFVHGACLGGGLALAACCDVVIAEHRAFFAMPEVRLGFAPAPLMPFFIAAVGPRHARRLLISGERFDAVEAQRIGLVHHLTDAAEAEPALTRRVTELMQAAPHAAARVKMTLRRLSDQTITPDLMAELQQAFRETSDSAEAQEGRAAFRAKRPPGWTMEP
jgi:methylglutaconyl-CoA hydratase